MSIVAIITDPGIGGTFLTWTLHYLAGHELYFNTKTCTWNKVPENPLTGINAHGFIPNQPIDLKNATQCLEILSTTPNEKFHTIYFHNFRNSNLDQTTFCQDTESAVSATESHADKVIVLSNQQKNCLYNYRFEGRVLTQKFVNPKIKNTSFQEQHEDFIEYFFKSSLDYWKNIGLTEIWDQREFLSLNLRPFKSVSILPYIDQAVEHYDLDCFELHTMFDNTINDLFNYLELTIDQDRKNHWQIIYTNWKKIHQSRLNFSWNFDKIISCILEGNYLDLTRFDLDLVQEACIQHELIYKHNLNLKTWKLDKFNNTQQLHQLLEKNQHKLNTNVEYYNTLTL